MAQERGNPFIIHLTGTGTLAGAFRVQHRSERRGLLQPFEGTVIARGSLGGGVLTWRAILGENPSTNGTNIDGSIPIDTFRNIIWASDTALPQIPSVCADLYVFRIAAATNADCEIFIYSRDPLILVDQTL